MNFIDRATIGLSMTIRLMEPDDLVPDRHGSFVTITDRNTGNFKLTFHDDMLPMLKRVVAMMEADTK